jgi:hypothetical protein
MTTIWEEYQPRSSLGPSTNPPCKGGGEGPGQGRATPASSSLLTLCLEVA